MKTWVKNRIAIEKLPRVLGATGRKVIKREGLVEERNRREGKILDLTSACEVMSNNASVPKFHQPIFDRERHQPKTRQNVT